MKTQYIVSALHNASSPAACLASWQSRPVAYRLRQLREYLAKPWHSNDSLASARASLINGQGPELSSPECEHPLLWLSGDSDPEVMDSFPGRDFLDHYGWFTDEFQEETLETYAVRLRRFPRLLFYTVKVSCNGDFRVALDEWQEIDFKPEAGSWDEPVESIRECAKEIIRSNESTTRHDAEDEIEYQRKDRIENDIAENRETLKSLRGEIRALAHELKTLCPSPMTMDYPAAAKALRGSLKSLLGDRRELMAENSRLASEL